MHRIALRGRVAIAVTVVAAVAALAWGPPGPINAGVAQTLQSRYVSVVDGVSPSVVQIQTAQALGSGVVFDGHGDVVTNAHVVAGSTRFSVTLSDGERVAATLRGTDPSTDLAVVHLTGATPPPATFSRSRL